MKKNVIALAVAAAMFAPLAAQADVAVSGVLQAELDNVSGDAVEGMLLTNGGRGKIEFKASEDLGNGMKAMAKYGADATVDGSAIAQRDAYVGISGGFGTILAGTMSNPYKSSTVSWDPFLETGAQARGNFGMSANKGLLHSGYTSNAIAYANKFGMANVVAAIVVDETNDDNDPAAYDNGHAGSFSVNMPVGPVEVALAYIKVPALGDESSATKLGVKYTAGAIGVAFQYETLDAAIADHGNDGETYTYINGTYAAGANTFAVAYGMNTASYVGGSDAENTYLSLGVIHGFSKSTQAYAAMVNTSNDAANADVSTLAVGLRVGF